MEQRFAKGSEEWLMFQDYWKLCQKYWKPEENDSYWEALINDANAFYETYKQCDLAKRWALALINFLDDKLKEQRRFKHDKE